MTTIGTRMNSKQIYTIIWIVLLQVYPCNSLSSRVSSILLKIRAKLPSKFPFSLPWYAENGLEFSCTGCGKCCQVDGDVWLAPEEISSIRTFLGMDHHDHRDEFCRKYIRAEISPAGKGTLQEKSNVDDAHSWMCLKRNEGSCIFLDNAGKCSIYDVRPVQCRTYPFWPSLLESPQTWKEESVLPDCIPITNVDMDCHWSPEHGGCEGIGISRLVDLAAQMSQDELNRIDLNQLLQQVESQTEGIVTKQEIDEKRKLAKKHWQRFPIEEIKQSTWYL
jgi:uncharacterized protein